ncbi:MAG TPA: mandelate racemase/muconate lactonizing enzyme family protein, partial [Acetobacteraceae bacterium]|nr:mandelate racemase/muconate lactonizing enzyme family protein [Acetobacteraceae bacterium]
MKIVDVRVLGVRVNHRGNWIFVQVETDDGIVGLGEASHSGDDAAVTFLIRHSLRPKLLGRDPSSVEAIWRDLAQRAAGGLLDGRLEATALSGIEHALWDVNGQALGVPIHRLLGGALRDRVRLYANINRHVTERSPEGFAKAAATAVSEGFTAVKLAPFDNVQWSQRDRAEARPALVRGIDRVAAVRDAIGPDIELMVDCHERFNREMAVRVGRELAKLGVVWFEDPTGPADDLSGLAHIRANVDLPLVTGERMFGRAAFWPLLQAGVVGTIMPDVKHCGGLWEGKKIAAMAEAARVMVSPHNPSGPIAALASVHLAATLPNFSRLEFAWGEVPWRAALTTPAEPIANGEFSVPQAPGLGA